MWLGDLGSRDTTGIILWPFLDMSAVEQGRVTHVCYFFLVLDATFAGDWSLAMFLRTRHLYCLLLYYMRLFVQSFQIHLENIAVVRQLKQNMCTYYIPGDSSGGLPPCKFSPTFFILSNLCWHLSWRTTFLPACINRCRTRWRRSHLSFE